MLGVFEILGFALAAYFYLHAVYESAQELNRDFSRKMDTKKNRGKMFRVASMVFGKKIRMDLVLSFLFIAGALFLDMSNRLGLNVEMLFSWALMLCALFAIFTFVLYGLVLIIVQFARLFKWWNGKKQS